MGESPFRSAWAEPAPRADLSPGAAAEGRQAESGGAPRRAAAPRRGSLVRGGIPPAAAVAPGMNGFAPEEVTQRGAEPAGAAVVVGSAGSAVEVPPPPPPPPGLGPGPGPAAAAGSAGGGCAGGPGAGQLCCLREEGERCGRAAGNASFSKRIQKSISQKKVKIELDKSVSPRGEDAPGQPAGRADKSGR